MSSAVQRIDNLGEYNVCRRGGLNFSGQAMRKYNQQMRRIFEIEPDLPGLRRRRFRPIPFLSSRPNLVTLLALCAGLTAVRFAVENKLDWAVGCIVLAAALDGIDGRLARLIKGTSRFGAELDSLADFVNFGVAPALMLYFWSLHDLKNVGWIVALLFAICAGLRLARFNTMLHDPTRPAWAANFFVGVPAPAGAIIGLLPLYVEFLGIPGVRFPALLTFLYTLAIAWLMVSRLPVFSARRSAPASRPIWCCRCSCWWLPSLRCCSATRGRS